MMDDRALVGTLWQSNDPRDDYRQFRVEALGLTTKYVFARNIVTGRRTRIRLDRLRDTLGKRGYTPVEE